ncbi:hypothetical protein RSOL_219290, partial [Rhizoctonia solani AG-3 Rhs1AP]
MTRSARDIVNSHLPNPQADSNNQPDDTEATSNESVGLYDYLPDDPRSREYVTRPRERVPTERNIQYRARRNSEESTRLKANDTRARNQSLRSTQGSQSVSQQRRTDGSPERAEPNPAHTEAVSSASQRRRTRQRGRSQTARTRSASPPVRSAGNHSQPPTQPEQPTQAPEESQYTYEYNTLDHNGLVSFAKEKFGIDVQGCDTQTIIRRLQLAKTEQTTQMELSGCSTSILVLSPTPFGVSGRWSQDAVRSLPGRPARKHSRAASDLSDGSSKRRCTEIVVENTDTESETDADDNKAPPRAPPLPTRDATPATVLDSEPSVTSSRSLGDPTPLLPNLIAPVTGPVHGRLRHTLLERFLDHADRTADAAEAAQAQAPTDRDQTAEVDEVPETEIDSAPNTSQRATPGSSHTPRTYGGSRSHRLPDPEASAEASTERFTPSQLIRRERSRAVAAKAHAEMATLARGRRRSRLFATALRGPVVRPQARPPLGARSNAVGQRMGGPRQLNPVSAARADMVAFNRAVAQGEATSLVESVGRQSQRTARCAPPASRPSDELLDDDEEMLAQAEAYAKGKWPRRSRVRKPKPLARDVSGIERQVLVMAKVHLFAYALVEGIYQTRATFLRWASAVHQATWQMELPGRSYRQPDDDIFEISSTPRYGDYEHPEIGHCIALVIFYGPNSVGVMYPDYFRDMPLTVVAFALAIWQFCLEEWSNGWRQNGDLGMGAMREKYEAQLVGLKALREAAPRRMARLQDQWRDYVAQYSGAVFDPEEVTDVEPTRRFVMRPDTPEPDSAISVEEMEARLLETARQNSLRSRMEEMAAQELEQPLNADTDEWEGSQAPTSRSSSPDPTEVNEYGVLTARAKGKGRAK